MADIGDSSALAGLGLHISNAIVKELGGDMIHFESKLGSGSYFYFYCPIAQRGIQVIDRNFESPEIYEENTSKIKIKQFGIEKAETSHKIDILVVDDSEFTHLVLTNMLS